MSDLAIYAELNIGCINTLIGQTFSAPSYDTLWWALARLPPATFKQLLQKWFANTAQQFRDQLLIIDGKRLKGVSAEERLVHLVELFASEQRLVLAQEKAGRLLPLPPPRDRLRYLSQPVATLPGVLFRSEETF